MRKVGTRLAVVYRGVLWLAPLLLAAVASARDKPDSWVEVRSPHFVVVSNSNEKQSRRVADQFERMRSVFHTLFPDLRIDPGTPIVVLAVKDEEGFRALEPLAYVAKGQMKLDGLFLRGADKNYVLLRLDAPGEHPYAVVYHEYTHLLLSKASGMPLWLDEGLAEFYQNTDIHEKDVILGQMSPENLQLLRQNRLLPLTTLFTVDRKSPYYHEENKGSIFYAESWALTHYLKYRASHDKTQPLTVYLQLMAQGIESTAAAKRAFGDLGQLQAELQEYIQQERFPAVKMSRATDIDEAAFHAEALGTAEGDAVRADFLAYSERTADARALLDQILKEDPSNVLAHETMGFLALRERHLDEARRWYEQAVKLDSQSYLAHYYFAATSLTGSLDAQEEARAETSLRASIRLNPNFAPSYDRLAALLAARLRNLDEARMMALTAIQLDPENMSYRMTTANVLLGMERGKDALAVMRNAIHLASSPEETERASEFLRHVEEYAQRQEQNQNINEQMKAEAVATGFTTRAAEPDAADSAPSREHSPEGPHRFVTGVLNNVHCDAPAIDLKVTVAGKTLELHSVNYFKIDYSVLSVPFKGVLDPCSDLEGRRAKVEYLDSTSAGPAAMVAIEIHK